MNNRIIQKEILADLPCAMGLTEVEGIEVPVYMVDFGKKSASLINVLEKNKHFYINYYQKENSVFTYYVFGDYVSEISKKINLFLSFEADHDSHKKFQTAFEKSCLWLLIVRSVADTYLVIKKSSGEIKQTYPSPR